jgi:hypothetical protein
MALFSSRPERFSVHRVRAETPTDIVAQISEERISLGQVFEGLKSGRYTAIFTEIASRGNSSNWKSGPVMVDAQHIDVNQTVMGLHPGLYEVTLEAAEFPMSFWVLFVDTEEYPKLDDEFRQVSTAIDAWGDDVPGDLKDSYKRAYLAFLNRQRAAKSAKQIR